MPYKDTYNYENYPYLPDRDDISLAYDPGFDEGLVGRSDTSGVGPPNNETYMNRAWMNVDQFNFLAGRLNSIAGIKPYTFNDYYEFFPYESGAYIVPTSLYSVEFLKNEEQYADVGIPADSLNEALYGTSGLLKYDVSTAMNRFMDGTNMRRSSDLCRGVSCPEGDNFPTSYITSAPEILFWYKTGDYDESAGGSIIDPNKAYTYYFGFINHTTGWWIKRNPEGWEDFEQWEAASYHGYSVDGSGPHSGSWWIEKATALGIPIKDEGDLPDNYREEMEKHGTDLGIGNYNYSITAEKTANPIRYSLQDPCHTTTGALGIYNTAYNYSGGGFLAQIPLEVFPVKTTNCSLGGLTYRSANHYNGGRISGIDWTYEKTPASWETQVEFKTDNFCDGNVYTYHTPGEMKAASRAKAVATTYPEYYVSRAAPADGISYDDLGGMPDYFVNQWMSDVSAGKLPGDSCRKDYIWSAGFYSDNDMFLKRGFSGGGIAGISYDVEQWTNEGGHQYVVQKPEDMAAGAKISALLGGADAATWDALGTESADSSSRIYQNKNYEGVFAGWPLGYHGGEIYQTPILRARHMLLNKEQAVSDGVPYSDYYGHNIGNKSRIHKNAYELLPYPPKKNLSYGLQDPTGADGAKIDPTRLSDPLNSFAKTYWIEIDDVKSKAEELGFRFEFRRLTVPFKFKNFSFSYARAGFMRETGNCLVKGGGEGEGAGSNAFYDPGFAFDGNDCASDDFCAPAHGEVLNSSTIYEPCINLHDNQPVFVQCPMNAGMASAGPFPNFVDHNPYGSDLEDGGWSKWIYRNPINMTYGDGFDSQNVIFHVGNDLQRGSVDTHGGSDGKAWGNNVVGDPFITGADWNAADIYPTGYGDSHASAPISGNITTQHGYFWCSDDGCEDCVHNQFSTAHGGWGGNPQNPRPEDGAFNDNLACPCFGEGHSGDGAGSPYGSPPTVGREHCYGPVGDGWATGWGNHKDCRDAWGALHGMRRYSIGEPDEGTIVPGSIIGAGGTLPETPAGQDLVQNCSRCYQCDTYGGGEITVPDGLVDSGSATLDDDDKKLFKFTGVSPDGTFTFNSIGYKPIVTSSKQFVWAENEGETAWVRPVGVQERYTYKYGSELSSYDMHVIDYMNEQAQLNDPDDPWRMESVSTWSGNYIYPADWPNAGFNRGDENALAEWGLEEIFEQYNGRYGEDDTAVGGGHGVFSIGSTIPPNVDMRIAAGTRTAYPYTEGSGPTAVHFKIRAYLSMLTAYDQIPILKITADDDYKEWLSNIILNLYPKYYYFQEFSDSEFARTHAMFVYGQPDVKYEDYPQSSIGDSEGYELGALDLVPGYTRDYPLAYGLDHVQNPGVSFEGETKFADWQKTRFPNGWFTNKRYIPLTNNQPSFFTDFWPRGNVNASGGYAQNLNFASTDSIFLNLQDTLGGQKAAIQWYINNAIIRPTGEGNPTHTISDSSWSY